MADLEAGPALNGQPLDPLAEPAARRWLVRMLALLVALLLVLAAAVTLGLRRQADAELDANRVEALAAAEHMAVLLSSMSTERAQSELDELQSLSTGNYRSVLVGLVPVLQETFKIGNVRSHGSVTAIGVERMDEDSVDVLSSVEIQVSDVKVPAGEARKYRIGIKLRHEGGRWLVSDVEVIP